MSADHVLVPYKLDPHESPGDLLQQPMSRQQASDIIAAFPLGPQRDDSLEWTNYASALYVFDRDAEALTAAEHAVSLNRNSTELFNLGLILEGYGRFVDALLLFAEANRADPGSILAGGAYGDALIRLGRWDVGWPYYALYHSHLTTRQVSRLDEIANRRILVICTAGVGDNIYHLRWLRHFRAAGCHITMKGPATLLSMLEGHPWIDELLPEPHDNKSILWYTNGPRSHAGVSGQHINLNDFDFRISTTSLAACVMPELDASIWPGPYISAPKSRWWGRRSGTRPRVGLCWKAGEKLFSRAHRTLNRKQVDRIKATLPSVEWIDLVADTNHEIHNWADTTRLVDSCDLIVSVDTGVAHLAGALGKRVFVALPGASAWCYGLGDAYKFAYPSMQAFRSNSPLIDSAVVELTKELRHAV
jgi:tetratricopeptide (TPR) repeat protein